MDVNKLLGALHKKFDTKTTKQLSEKLGVSVVDLDKWKTTGLTELKLANTMVKSRQQAEKAVRHSMIRPVVEFYPIDAVDSEQGVKYELFPSKGKHEATTFQIGLRKALSEKNGIYIFYDSRGRALYAGKAQKTSLWTEMKDAFNRNRNKSERVQTVVRAIHPTRNKEFLTAEEQHRQLRKTQLELSELAAYFSAYEVDVEMIDELEALLVRGFANDLLNVKMETFGKSRRKVNN